MGKCMMGKGDYILEGINPVEQKILPGTAVLPTTTFQSPMCAFPW